MCWSGDATQLAAACADGHVVSAHCIKKRLEWNEFEVLLVSRKTAHVRNIVDDTQDVLEMRDRVIKMALGYGHLVVVTSTQCLIYASNNFNTPAIFELRSPGSVSFVQQCRTCFALVDAASVLLYTYEGRQVSLLRLPGQLRTYMLNGHTLALSHDVVAVKDGKDERQVHLFDTSTGRLMADGAGSSVQHQNQVTQVSLSQCGDLSDRYVAVIDKNHDVYVAAVTAPAATLKKLAAMVQAVQWNRDCNMLCGLRDTKLLVWFYPKCLFVDANILPLTVTEQEASDSGGKNLTLLSYIGSCVALRRADGSRLSVSVSPYPIALHELMNGAKWPEAVRLCRFAKNPSLWACLAAMAVHWKNLDTAEVAYAAIREVDKVEYLAHIRDMPNKDVRAAKMALFCGNFGEAEAILQRAGFIYHIIQLNMDLFEWERALEVAIKHKTHIDTVLGFRQLYLREVGKQESSNKFQQYSQGVKIHWDKIRAKVDAELEAVGDLN